MYGFLLGCAAVVVYLGFEALLKRETAAKKWPESTWTWGLFLVAGAALVGARAYHVVIDWQLYADQPWWSALAVWNGGLAWFGAILGIGLGVLTWRTLQKPRLSWTQMLDALAMTVPWGQAIGRWGNYFNQEVFGPPTQLPWGIYISPENRPATWAAAERFHPLFLYEALGNIFIGGTLFWLWKWGRNQKALSWLKIGSGSYLALYCIGYGMLRFGLDFLRDEPKRFAGILLDSQVLSLVLLAFGLIILQRSMQKWLRLLAAGLTISLFLFTPHFAQAQQAPPVDLSITPAVVEVLIQPGKSVSRAFTVKNLGTENLNATVSLRDFVSDSLSGTPVILESSQFPHASLINSDRSFNTPFVLGPGDEQQLVLSLDIPEDAQERDWYVVLLVQTESVQRDPLINSRALSQGTIGATLLIRVSRTESIPLQWGVKFPKLPKVFDSLRALHIEPLVENLNPSLAIPDLSIVVRNWRGEVVYSQAALPERVLAGSTRVIRAQETDPNDPRSLVPKDFVYDPPFAIGPYTVEARVSNQAGAPLLVQQKVWAAPVSLIVVLGGLILALQAKRILSWKRSAKRKKSQSPTIE